MPTPQMFTNIEVLKQAAKNVKWKIDTARQVVGSVPKPFKDQGSTFDVRHPTDIASLIIDTDAVPEEQREEYFCQETEKIARAFFTLDKKTNLPYPEAIKPYIKMVYDKMTIDTNIDWNNVKEVEKLFATMKASQSFATFVEDFPRLVMELYPTIEDVKWLDNFTAKSTLICHDALISLDSNPETDTIKTFIGYGRESYNTFENKIISETGHQVIDARIAGSDVINLDFMASDLTKKHFLDETFEVDNRGYSYSSNDFSRDYLEALAGAYRHTSVEQRPVAVISGANGELYAEFSRLYINGKSAQDSILELQEKKDYPAYKAKAIVGKMLTDALTDGKSIVTIMQTVTGANGKTEFRHQELKVNLNQLNKVDKDETNYSLFRRFLDWAHIWKIQRFPSNETRDAAQSKLRESKDFQNALRAAEESFINKFNGDKVQSKDFRLLEGIPKIVRAEEFEKNNQIENKPERIQLTDVGLESSKNVAIEPKHTTLDKTLSNDSRIK